MERMNRQAVAIFQSHQEAEDYGFMPGTPESRVLSVWELTQEIWGIAQNKDVERRLQRHVENIDRREG